VKDPDLPFSGYNYSALPDHLMKKVIEVSMTRIIDRAKKLGYHKHRRKRKVHDREVLTASFGALVQPDSSLRSSLGYLTPVDISTPAGSLNYWSLPE
jgi:hypothetical protein